MMITMYCLHCDTTDRMDAAEFKIRVPSGKPHCIRCGKRMPIFLAPFPYPEEDEVPVGYPALLG